MNHLPATNDAAERGVALVKQFKKFFIKDEDQKQGLYVAVAIDRTHIKQKWNK